MPREIVVDWTTDAGSGFVSVFFFSVIPSVASQRASLAAMLGDLDQSLVTTCSWTIRQEGRSLNDTTGALQAAWSDPTGQTGTGATASEPVPDASQILVRWATETIVAGRFLKGRTFIPGLAASGTINGNIGPSVVPVLATAASGLIDDNLGFGVWHRPVQGAGGVFVEATSASVWDELAVLRRRRQ